MAHQGTERPGAHFDYAGLIRFRFLKDLNHRWTLISQEEAERTESRNDGAKKWRQKDFNADAHPCERRRENPFRRRFENP